MHDGFASADDRATFIAARVAYIGAYLADRATLRSLIWVIGLGLSITLLALG